MAKAEGFYIEHNNKGLLHLRGTLDLYHAPQAKVVFEKAFNETGDKPLTMDGAELAKLDTVGAMLLKQLQNKRKLTLKLKPEHQSLYELVNKADIKPLPAEELPPPHVRFIRMIGKRTIDMVAAGREITSFIGHAFCSMLRSSSSPRRMRLPLVIHHIEHTGIYAVPIIALIAFLISIVLAYQGIAQLRPLGAQNLTVNLVSISVLREMGVLLTAIMVAGRSGSAFTAEIGVMKVREEVDALQVTGINPFEVLVMPRLVALLITLPILTFIADIMGLLGGGVMAMFIIDMPMDAFFAKARQVADINDFMVGMIKAPVFAFLIAMVGCMHGMKVSGSAESVGRETTASVVKSIFLVLVADAFFSIVFEKIGL